MSRAVTLVALLCLFGATSVFAQGENAAPANNTAKKGNPIEQIDAFIEQQKKAGKIDMSKSTWRSKLPKFPEIEYPGGTDYFWNLKTNKGDIKLRLWSEYAPDHATNFIYLSKLGFFDGLNFHRVITGFMAQGGCPEGSGRGNPGYRFAGEFDYKTPHDKPGLLSMANAGPNTDGSQFFITFRATPHLDGKHTLFGEVVDGMDTVKKLEEKGSAAGPTSEPLLIEKATITTAKSPNRQLLKSNLERAAEFLTSKEIDVKKARQTDSGLWIIDVKEGEGAAPKPESTVEVHYTGWFVDGKEFDSSHKRGTPAKFPLNGVIKGWTEGVGSMKEGGKRYLVIPYDIAYGARGRSGIPGHAMLVFEVELLRIVK